MHAVHGCTQYSIVYSYHAITMEACDCSVACNKLTMRDIVGGVQVLFVVFIEEVLALTADNLQRKLWPVVQLL